MNNLILQIGGTQYGGWKSVNVRLSIEDLCGSFQISLSDKWSSDTNARQIRPNDSCTILLDGETVLTGYVDRVSPSYSAQDHTIAISGRDKAGDLVDCSAVGADLPSNFSDLKIEDIITKICAPFNISVTTKTSTGEKLKTFNIEQGMSAFECIQKLAKMRRCLVISDGFGGIIITRAANGSLGGLEPLVEGTNILKGSGDYDATERFSVYVCKGQQQGTSYLSVDETVGGVGYAQDSSVPRYRPLMIIADGQAATNDCYARANWELAVRRAKARRITITYKGWRDSNGNLWAINNLVSVSSPLLAVSDNLLIAAVNFTLSSDGALTELTLVAPDAYLTFDVGTQAKGNAYLTGGDQ